MSRVRCITKLYGCQKLRNISKEGGRTRSRTTDEHIPHMKGDSMQHRHAPEQSFLSTNGASMRDQRTPRSKAKHPAQYVWPVDVNGRVEQLVHHDVQVGILARRGSDEPVEQMEDKQLEWFRRCCCRAATSRATVRCTSGCLTISSKAQADLAHVRDAVAVRPQAVPSSDAQVAVAA